MPRRVRVIHDLPALRRTIARYRGADETVGLVPTMGALHAGHLSLVRLARRKADRVVVSIFVNPTQFAPHEDLATYPRTLSADLAALAEAEADLVWAPPVEVMYPFGEATRIAPAGPAQVGLEDRSRPHFFAGVATVVTKLFLQCAPDFAVFGEKDYQQLKVVTHLAKDLAIPIRVVPGATRREKDGLAMSSRNAYLDPAQRSQAPTLYRVLRHCADQMRAGRSADGVLSEGRAAIEDAGFALDYLELRHADTLEPLAASEQGPRRLLVAAKIGTTRLIDNVAV